MFASCFGKHLFKSYFIQIPSSFYKLLSAYSFEHLPFDCFRHFWSRAEILFFAMTWRKWQVFFWSQGSWETSNWLKMEWPQDSLISVRPRKVDAKVNDNKKLCFLIHLLFLWLLSSSSRNISWLNAPFINPFLLNIPALFAYEGVKLTFLFCHSSTQPPLTDEKIKFQEKQMKRKECYNLYF